MTYVKTNLYKVHVFNHMTWFFNKIYGTMFAYPIVNRMGIANFLLKCKIHLDIPINLTLNVLNPRIRVLSYACHKIRFFKPQDTFRDMY